jgi:hypothetical protein
MMFCKLSMPRASILAFAVLVLASLSRQAVSPHAAFEAHKTRLFVLTDIGGGRMTGCRW